MKVNKLAGVKAKKTCCRSKPRFNRCPLALHKVRKAEPNGLRGKDLLSVYKRTEGLTPGSAACGDSQRPFPRPIRHFQEYR